MNECGCCGDEKFLTPGDPLPEEDPDFLLHETNRLQRRVSIAASIERKRSREAQRGLLVEGTYNAARKELDEALDEWEKLEEG